MKRNKRQKQSKKLLNEKEDRLSALPDGVLVHILGSMDTLFAVRTSVLSKRWNDLWKDVTNLSFKDSNFAKLDNHDIFVSWVLSIRDGSLPLNNLHYDISQSGSELLDRVVEYAVSHNVQQLTIIAPYSNYICPFVPLWSCQSLSSLDLDISPYGKIPVLSSQQLPALKRLSLGGVHFDASESGYVEPFSKLNLLESLFINRCSLPNNVESLYISNLNLSSLKIRYFCHEYKIVLSTPSLCSFKVEELSSLGCREISSTCNLSSLAEVNLDTSYTSCQVIIGWLQVFANTKKLIVSPRLLRAILSDLSSLYKMRSQPPCFARLELLKVDLNPYTQISWEEIHRTTKYLLQNSALRKVIITNFGNWFS